MANYAMVKSAIALKQARFHKVEFLFQKSKITSSGIIDADN
ncbi:MAG: hypothetical protein V7K32_16145 [Nostoc sp.]